MTTPQVEVTQAMMREWLGWLACHQLHHVGSGNGDIYPLAEYVQNALKQAAQWGYDQGQAERAAAMASLRKSAAEAGELMDFARAQLQEARDQQLDECCKWLEQRSGTAAVLAGDLRDACRPKVDDSEAADAARMRWLLQGHGYPTYLAISEVTAWLKENDSTWNVGGDAARTAARREIDKRMARTVEYLAAIKQSGVDSTTAPGLGG